MLGGVTNILNPSQGTPNGGDYGATFGWNAISGTGELDLITWGQGGPGGLSIYGLTTAPSIGTQNFLGSITNAGFNMPYGFFFPSSISNLTTRQVIQAGTDAPDISLNGNSTSGTYTINFPMPFASTPVMNCTGSWQASGGIVVDWYIYIETISPTFFKYRVHSTTPNKSEYKWSIL